MGKARLCLALVLVWFLAGRVSRSTTTIIYPQIVASVALTNQRSPILSTTLVTPDADGLYRVSTYLAMTTPGTTNGGWTLYTSWFDDAHKAEFNISSVSEQAIPPLDNCNGTNLCPQVTIARVKAGKPLAYKVAPPSQTGDHGVYELFITVEQLQ